MAIYHLSIKIVSRGKGKSAVAAAAYRSGETIKNEYDGIIHDYTRKSGIVHTEIILPENAPPEYADRAVLWNAVEKVEKAKNSQLAREIELALPVELTKEQNISLAREYIKKHFVDKGMCADICVHDTGKGNPHAHVLVTMRPFNEDKNWGEKQKKEYILDGSGEKIYDQNKRQYKCKSIPTTDWNEQDKAEEWRAAWSYTANAALERENVAVRIDHRSYRRQGVDKMPSVRMGVAATQMERRGIRTERGDINREIEVTNQRLRELKARIVKLQNWLKEETTNIKPPTLAEVIQGILSRQPQTGKSSVSQSVYNLKNASKMLNFLTDNNIKGMMGLDGHFKSMIDKQANIREELKPVERRLKTLNEHIKQADIYMQYRDIYREYRELKPKNQEAFFESHRMEITLYEAVGRYLKGVMNGRTGLPIKKWKAERDKLILEQKRLNQEYVSLKDEVKEVEQIRKSVHSIMRIEAREQKPQRARSMEL